MRQFFFRVLIVLILASVSKPLSAGFSAIPRPILIPKSEVQLSRPEFEYATDGVWSYLRRGLNYLESPLPLLPPEAVHPSYMHPDSKGFGSYGLSPAAYEDVQRLYPYFRNYSWEAVLSSPALYDLGSRAFADHIIRDLQVYIPQGASNKDVFDVVHKAWNLGLRGFKSGRCVVRSRLKRAEEFVNL